VAAGGSAYDGSGGQLRLTPLPWLTSMPSAASSFAQFYGLNATVGRKLQDAVPKGMIHPSSPW
jgi:hypothetical protein